MFGRRAVAATAGGAGGAGQRSDGAHSGRGHRGRQGQGEWKKKEMRPKRGSELSETHLASTLNLRCFIRSGDTAALSSNRQRPAGPKQVAP